MYKNIHNFRNKNSHEYIFKQLFANLQGELRYIYKWAYLAMVKNAQQHNQIHEVFFFIKKKKEH